MLIFYKIEKMVFLSKFILKALVLQFTLLTFLTLCKSTDFRRITPFLSNSEKEIQLMGLRMLKEESQTAWPENIWKLVLPLVTSSDERIRNASSAAIQTQSITAITFFISDFILDDTLRRENLLRMAQPQASTQALVGQEPSSFDYSAYTKFIPEEKKIHSELATVLSFLADGNKNNQIKGLQLLAQDSKTSWTETTWKLVLRAYSFKDEEKLMEAAKAAIQTQDISQITYYVSNFISNDITEKVQIAKEKSPLITASELRTLEPKVQDYVHYFDLIPDQKRAHSERRLCMQRIFLSNSPNRTREPEL